MRIGFNGQRLASQRLGVGRYIEYMLRHWHGMLAAGEEVRLLLRRPLSTDAAAYLHLAPPVTAEVLGPDMPGILWENMRLPARAPDMDVLFCPAYTAPLLSRTPTVVATHSVNELQPGAHAWWYPATYGRINRLSAQHAHTVIVPCEATRQDVASAYGIDPARIAVVPQGADDCFQPMADGAALVAVRTRFFGGDRPYVLFVGKCSARRNIPLLLRAFAAVKHEDHIPHGLLLFGPNPEGLPLDALCAELGIAGDVVRTDGVISDHRDLVPIYNAADVFVHPSLYEGWSMTTVEALACGAAVIAANRGGLGEVADGHALMVDDPTVDSLADALRRVLRDSSLRADLRARARARGSRLRWSDTTRQTLDVVRQAAAAN